MKIQYRSFKTRRFFGVEGEFSQETLSRNQIALVLESEDPNHLVKVTNYSLSDGSSWHVKTDATCGWEVASYKGRGFKDLDNISKCLSLVASAGAKITSHCGLHIHADVSDLSETQVAKIGANWIKIEPILFSIVPSHRSSNIYCKNLRRKFLRKKESKSLKDKDFYDFVVRPFDFSSKRERRVALNFCNYEESRVYSDFNRSTIELRLPEMTSNSEDIKSWVRLFLTFLENSSQSSFPSNLDIVNLPDALEIMGLHKVNGGLILSNGLFNTKEWFLLRILKFSKNQKLCMDAVTMLNNMWFPLRKYQFDRNARNLIVSKER